MKLVVSGIFTKVALVGEPKSKNCQSQADPMADAFKTKNNPYRGLFVRNKNPLSDPEFCMITFQKVTC